MHQHSWVVQAAMLASGLRIIGIVSMAGLHGRKGCAVGALSQGTAALVMHRAWYEIGKRHQDLHPHQHLLDFSHLFGRRAVMVHLLLCRGQATQKTLSVRAVGQDSWRRGKPDRNYIVMINNFLLEGLTRTPIIGHVGIFISDPHNLFPLVVCVNLPSFPCVCFSRDFCTSIFYAFLSFPVKTTCQVCRNTLHFHYPYSSRWPI